MKKFIPLWLIIFISFFCYSSMLTMFVPLLQDKLSPMFIHEYSLAFKNVLSGIFLSLYPLGQFFGSPIIGAFSDRFGRKKILVISLLVTIFCLLIIGYSILIKSLILLGIACFIAGLGESNMGIALSAIADITTNEERNGAFAKAWVMCSIGYITGSMFGGVASFIGYINPFLIEAVIVAIGLLSVLILFNDKYQECIFISFRKILITFGEVFKKTTLRPYYLANFISYIACFGVLRVELIYMQDYFNLTQLQISIYYSFASIVAMLSNFILTPFLLKKMSLSNVVICSGLLAMFSSVLFIIINNPNLLWLTTGLIGCFIPIMVAMIGALISSKSLPNEHGSVMGNNQSLQVVAEAISAVLGGIIFSINAQLPFLLFAIIGAIGLIKYKNLTKLKV